MARTLVAVLAFIAGPALAAPFAMITDLKGQAWAMDGFTGLVFNGKGLTDIAGDLAVLSAFALALLALGVLLLRRTLTRST